MRAGGARLRCALPPHRGGAADQDDPAPEIAKASPARPLLPVSSMGQPPRSSRPGADRASPSRSYAEIVRGTVPLPDSSHQPMDWEVEAATYRHVSATDASPDDLRLRQEIYDRFAEDDSIDTGGLWVEVQDGGVTLRGSVEGPRDLQAAEAIARAVEGVKDVSTLAQVRGARRST